MASDWNQIDNFLDALTEKDSFNIAPVQNKQNEILSLVSELKSMVTDSDGLLEELVKEIELVSQNYAEQMLSQLDSAEGMLETLAQTKATIDKDLSLKKTLELEIVQLSARKRVLEKEVSQQSKEREEVLHQTSQLEQELTLEVGNIERYKQAQQEMHQKLAVLEEESKELRTENAKLQTKLKNLEENIEGMKLLKEEHMLSIMQNTEVLSKISSGTE